MRQEVWRTRVFELLSHGKNHGFVTHDSINSILEEEGCTVDQIEDVLMLLAAAGVEVVESGEDRRGGGLSGLAGKQRDEREDLTTPDPLEAYVRDLAQRESPDAETEQSLTSELRDGIQTMRLGVVSCLEGREALSVLADNLKSPHGSELKTFLESLDSRMTDTDDPCVPTSELEEIRDQLWSLLIKVTDWEEIVGQVESVLCSKHEDEASAQESLSLIREGMLMAEAARTKLVEGHTRLVLHLAKRYSNRGVEYIDLVQEGNTGLIRAAARFDPSRGNTFHSYATWWIRQSIAKAVSNQGRAVRIPATLASELRRLNRTREDLSQDLGRNPTLRELAAALELDEKSVERLLQVSRSSLRLDQPSGQGDDTSLADVIDLKEAETGINGVDRTLMKREIEAMISSLEADEQLVLRKRFGFDDDSPLGLDEVSEILQLSKKKVKQIEEQALKKLRHLQAKNELAGE